MFGKADSSSNSRGASGWVSLRQEAMVARGDFSGTREPRKVDGVEIPQMNVSSIIVTAG
jgi:hypothetical protein